MDGIYGTTVIVGAGPAGLAVGACLRRRDEEFVILERRDSIGSAWRTHYDRLHLHTDKRHSELPYASYPDSFPKYPARLQVVRYLEDYAESFDLAPVFNQEVVSIDRDDGAWTTRTRANVYRSRNVVVATGYTRVPRTPTWPGLETFPGEVLHSSSYRNGERFSGMRVLVVGLGNSGGEIAIDLVEHGADVEVSVRNPVNLLPRELFGIPILGIAVAASKLPVRVADLFTAPILRLKFGDLRKLGLRKLSYGPLTQIKKDARIPLIDIGTIDLIRRRQLTVRSGIRRFDRSVVSFDDGSTAHFDAMILATGYIPKVGDFLRAPGSLGKEGEPLSSGIEAEDGLYFCGFHVSPTGMLREIAKEAKSIARNISTVSAATSAPSASAATSASSTVPSAARTAD